MDIENDIVLINQYFLLLFKVTYATDATTDDCGDAATSYYKEFLYNGKRVIVSNNVQQLVILISQDNKFGVEGRFLKKLNTRSDTEIKLIL